MGPGALERLQVVADVVFLDFDGEARQPGPPPTDERSVGRLRRFVADLDALVLSYGSPRVTDEIMDGAPRLKMIGDTHGDRFAARVDVVAATRRGIAVSDTTNGSSGPVAEWALALVLIGLRNAGSLFRRLIAGEVLWPDREAFVSDPGYLNGELQGKTVGLVAIGVNVNDRGLSRRHLLAQIDRSLSRLRTDHVDIFYAHHPDPDTPLETTAGEWGCPPAQLALAWALQRPTVASAIIGPESSEELEEVVGAVDLGAQLSAEQYRRLDEIGATGVTDPSPRPPDAP
jgi:aryl-alcohol dehydrogenase-like predicted oxidoreductase